MTDDQNASGLSLTGRPWIWPSTTLSPAEPATRVPSWLTHLLSNRGVSGEQAVQRFLEPTLASLHDPGDIADMAVAVQRLAQAIHGHEPIALYGDYDVDGVGSTAILTEFLRACGAQVSYYIPNRRTEGYGLNEQAVRALAPTAKLLVTVDTGVTAHGEIALARSLGLDVIVVDHHQVHDGLPPALAVLDPHREDCHYPCKDLCAAGVTFMLIGALRRYLREQGSTAPNEHFDVRELLDIVALATIADMVPIRDANRVLVASGLQWLARTRRPGLRALMEVSRVDPRHLTATDVAFRLAPRINARGRISDADEAVELLLTENESYAQMLAGALDAANRERRDIEKHTLSQALNQVDQSGAELGAALVLMDDTWHPGVLGLVASRLTARYARPAIVIGQGGRGSARSVPGLDIHASIAAASAHLVRFGGHSAAAGITIMPEKVDAFRQAWTSQVRARLGEPPYIAPLAPDMVLNAHAVDLHLLEKIELLAPFGQQNPEPIFVAAGLCVSGKRLVGENHLKLQFAQVRHDAVGFGLGGIIDKVPDTVDVAFRLARNNYRGETKVELIIEDVRAALATPKPQ